MPMYCPGIAALEKSGPGGGEVAADTEDGVTDRPTTGKPSDWGPPLVTDEASEGTGKEGLGTPHPEKRLGKSSAARASCRLATASAPRETWA